MRWRLAFALTAWAGLVAGCGTAVDASTTVTSNPPATTPTTATTAPLPAFTSTTVAQAFSAPSFEPPDPGIAFVTAVNSPRLENDFQVRTAAFQLLIDDGTFGLDDAGVRLEIDRCEIVAPNHWLIGGTATVPDGNPLALIGLRFESYNPDLFDIVGGYPNTTQDFVVELTRSGSFTLHHDRASVQSDIPDDRFPIYDVGPVCRVSIVWSLAALTGPLEMEIERSTTLDPLTWEAPEGSIQALGVGAILGDPTDSRSAWAYATWEEWALPFRQIAVASVPDVWSADAARSGSNGPCDWVETTYRHVNQVNIGELLQSIRCDRTDLVGEMNEAGSVAGAAGWTYLELPGPSDPVGGEEPWLRATTSVGGFDLYAFLPASEAVFVEFLNSFQWLENLVVG